MCLTNVTSIIKVSSTPYNLETSKLTNSSLVGNSFFRHHLHMLKLFLYVLEMTLNHIDDNGKGKRWSPLHKQTFANKCHFLLSSNLTLILILHKSNSSTKHYLLIWITFHVPI